MRNLLVLGSSIGALHSALAYYTMVTYSPESPEIDGKIINANSRSFIIGAKSPSTYCDINNPSECPNSSSTLVNNDMTLLAVRATPGLLNSWHENIMLILQVVCRAWRSIHLGRP